MNTSGQENQRVAPLLCANACGFYGSPTTRNLCSKCYRNALLLEQQQQEQSQLKHAENPAAVATSVSSSPQSCSVSSSSPPETICHVAVANQGVASDVRDNASLRLAETEPRAALSAPPELEGDSAGHEEDSCMLTTSELSHLSECGSDLHRSHVVVSNNSHYGGGSGGSSDYMSRNTQDIATLGCQVSDVGEAPAATAALIAKTALPIGASVSAAMANTPSRESSVCASCPPTMTMDFPPPQDVASSASSQFSSTGGSLVPELSMKAATAVTSTSPLAAASPAAATSALSVCPQFESVQGIQQQDASSRSAIEEDVVKPIQVNKNRCFKCHKRIGLLGFQCRCTYYFCGAHRHADCHDCPFDYKSFGRQQLSKANQRVVADKLNRI